MAIVNEDNIHLIMDNLPEVLNSPEFIKYSEVYDKKIVDAVESISIFLTKYQEGLNLMDAFIAYRDLYVELELLMEYQVSISRLIAQRGLEIKSMNK